MLEKLKAEIFSHKIIYFLLGLTLLAGLFLRVYRINDLLGFYYDQGRDALVVWDLLQNLNVPFIGPVTGIAGIFRGPFYYYLLAPFYLLGGGNPIYPSVFLSLTAVLAIILIYYLGYKILSRETGLIAAIIASFSFNIVMASRWLSNPTPMLLLSMILVLGMLKVSEGRKNWWIVISTVVGLSLFHFGSSGEFFYFLALAIFAFWTVRRQGYGGRSTFNNRVVAISGLLFLLTTAPLIAFDIKNNGLLSTNIKNFLFGQGSFGFPGWRQIGDKIEFLYDVFTNKIFNGRYIKEQVLMGAVAFTFVYYLHKLVRNQGVKILLLLLITGSIGIIFFQGNFGNIYDYYLTGYYLIFVLLFSVGLGALWERRVGKIFVLYFLYFFLVNNSGVLRYKLSDPVDGQQSVAFKNQKQSIEWIYKDAKDQNFNVDVYVPPVIPYAYNYLFKWYPTTPRFRGTSGWLVEEHVPLLYTFYEVDPPHPERLEAWLARQVGIGEVEEEARFGGITVQRRKRI